MFREEFLHFVWKFQLLNHNNIEGTNGESISISKAGILNQNSGPDFSNAKIRIDDIEWAGNVEIHTKSSDWIKHKHQIDKAYNNIILQVVWEDDIDFFSKFGIPTLVLNGRIQRQVLEKYAAFNFLERLPCSFAIKTVDTIVLDNWYERMAVERLVEKSNVFLGYLNQHEENWQQALFILLAKNFGFKKNAIGFELMAKATPIEIILKHIGNIHQVEAILYGQSGMLKSPKEEYQESLIYE